MTSPAAPALLVQSVTLLLGTSRAEERANGLMPPEFGNGPEPNPAIRGESVNQCIDIPWHEKRFDMVHERACLLRCPWIAMVACTWGLNCHDRISSLLNHLRPRASTVIPSAFAKCGHARLSLRIIAIPACTAASGDPVTLVPGPYFEEQCARRRRGSASCSCRPASRRGVGADLVAEWVAQVSSEAWRGSQSAATSMWASRPLKSRLLAATR